MANTSPLYITLTLGLLITACSGNSEKNASTTENQNKTSESSMEVKKAENDNAQNNNNAMSPTSVIQTKAGPGGLRVDLTKANIVGKVLTVELNFTPTIKHDNGNGYKTALIQIPVDDVNYIDDNTAKKYTVLKDQDGKYMASPIESSGKINTVSDGNGAPVNVSFRFPAPPDDTKTVSISIPGTQSFDGVTITR